MEAYMTDCIFCNVIAGDIPSTNVFRDQQVTAFRDIHPMAPTHILIVPNRHIESVNSLTTDDEQLIGHLFMIAKELAAQEGFAENGYRLIMNTGPHAGQTVFHVHLHLLGGGRMKHPMG
jgi:histidine triad (HIT) family protein